MKWKTPLHKQGQKPNQHSRITFLLISHWRALKHSLKEVIQKPLSCCITAIIIGVTLAIPAILFILLHNVEMITAKWSAKPTISAYIKQGTSLAEISALSRRLQFEPNVASVKYISPKQGLKDFKQFSAFSDVIPLLKSNPLPGVITITLKHLKQGTNSLALLLNTIQNNHFIDQTSLDTQWIERMDSILTIAKRVILALTILLSAGLILIVSNTVRLNTQSYRREMQVLKAVGATPAYIRRPFLYHGVLYGCLGGLLAWGFVRLVFNWIWPPAAQLIESYHAQFQLEGTNALAAALIILIATGVSLSGAWLAIANDLRQSHLTNTS